jgi:hypothetical protein
MGIPPFSEFPRQARLIRWKAGYVGHGLKV